MKYRGSCHCGRIAFEVEGEIDETLACNWRRQTLPGTTPGGTGLEGAIQLQTSTAFESSAFPIDENRSGITKGDNHAQ
jgi:hypothetical protein